MLLKNECVACGDNVEFDSNDIGQVVACPNCGNKMRLQSPKDAAASLNPGAQKPTEPPSQFPPGFTASIPKPTAIPEPAAFTPLQQPTRNTFTNTCSGCLIIGFVCALLVVIIVGLTSKNATPEDQINANRRQAYYMAKSFILKQIVGARSVGDITECGVDADGSKYTVQVPVDGLNAFGGPVRNTVTVIMTYDGNDWRLVSIDQLH